MSAKLIVLTKTLLRILCFDIVQVTRNSLRYRISNSGSLTIQNARSSDTGHYIGTATNVAGRGSVEFDVSKL